MTLCKINILNDTSSVIPSCSNYSFVSIRVKVLVVAREGTKYIIPDLVEEWWDIPTDKYKIAPGASFRRN